jgi:Rieske Fe-S protein
MLLNRRQLFAAGIAGSVAGLAAITLRYLWPLDAEPPPVTRIAADDVPGSEDAPYPIHVDHAKAYVVAVDANDLIALLRKCTNEGCTVVWVERGAGLGQTYERVFRCPCCGSLYARDGANAWGPAPSPLARLLLEQHSDGDVFVSLPKVTALQHLVVPR